MGGTARVVLLTLAAGAAAALCLTAGGRSLTATLGPLRVSLHGYVNPLIAGVLASIALLLAARGRPWWRRAAMAALVALGMLGVVNAGVHAPPVVTESDLAVGELYTELATRGQLLVGPYSRFGWHHPGPLYFYVSAPFYAWSGHRAATLYAVALAINLTSLATMAWVLVREGRGRFGAGVLGACLFFAWRAPGLLASPWTGHVAVLPCLAFLVLAAAVAAGRPQWLPLLVAFGTFAAQTHVGFVPTVLLITAAAIVSAATRGANRSTLRSSLNAAGWTAMLLWLLPIAEAVAHRGGNVRQLWRFFSTAEPPGHSVRDAFVNAAYGLTGMLRPDFDLPWGGHFDLAHPGLAAIGASLLVVMLVLAARRDLATGLTFEGCLALVAVGGTIVGCFGLTRIRGDILNHDLFRIAAVGALAVGVVASAGMRAAARAAGGWAPTARGAWLVWLVLAGATVLGIRDLEARTAFDRRQQARGAILRAYEATASYLARDGIYKPLIGIGPDRWSDAAGVVLRLLQHDVPVAVTSDQLPMFTDRFAATGEEDAIVTFADLELHRTLRANAGTEVLFDAFPLFVDAQRLAPAAR